MKYLRQAAGSLVETALGASETASGERSLALLDRPDGVLLKTIRNEFWHEYIPRGVCIRIHNIRAVYIGGA